MQEKKDPRGNDKIFVVGHKNPDTDSICSAIAYAEFKQMDGINAVAARAGEINPETKFVLEHFDAEEPVLLESAAGKKIILVDHNEKSQAVDGIDKAEIMEIIDHHRIGDIETPSPIFFHAEPVGSSATIIADFFEKAGKKLSKKTAGLLLSALLSDTVILKSATTTDKDKEVAKRLASIVNEDIESFGMEIKKAKSSIAGKSARDIIKQDFKIYDLSKKIAVCQIEIVDDEEVKKMREELLEEMEKVRKEEQCALIAMMVTNIMREGTELLVAGDESIVEEAFGKVVNHSIYLPGVMSRKKQVIPKLEKILNK